MQLLLIEDDDDLRSEIHEHLARLRHGVTALASFAESRRKLGQILSAGESLDAVVCDINLRDGDGIDLYVEFATRRPTCRWILMSGDPDPERLAGIRLKNQTLPPCVVVEKPVSMHRLAQILTGEDSGVRL